MIAYRVEINDGAVTKLFNRLDHSAVMRVLRPPMEASLLSLHDDLTDNPPKSTGKVRFKSAKQRRYFFWALKQGVITVPYHREGKLGQSWTTKIDETGSGMYGKNRHEFELCQVGAERREPGADPSRQLANR